MTRTLRIGPAGSVRSALTAVVAAVLTTGSVSPPGSVVPEPPRPVAATPAPSSDEGSGARPDGVPAPVCTAPWSVPVDAPVTDPFRPPDHRYGPGNRGIEYGTTPGQDVAAVAAGVVQFVGPVAGRPVVVVAHGGGLRSSYVNLQQGLVARGQVVAGGQRIATADAAFHLGARQGRRYLDPARLIERLCLVVRLVPE